MQISNLLSKNLIFFNQSFSSKAAALKFLSQKLVAFKYASSQQKVYDLFSERETIATTGVGDGIAIPHLRDPVMLKSTIAFIKVKPLDWKSLDQKPVQYIFAIAMSKAEGESSHLTVLANLSKLLINQKFINDLNQVSNANQLINLFNHYENLVATKTNDLITNDANYDVVAITACPTGIAHTFMAAEQLEKAAKALKVKIKVECQGTEGAKNVLSAQEINHAQGVILAIDRAVATERFASSNNVIETTTSKAIAKPTELIKAVLDQKGSKLKNITSDSVQATNFSQEGTLSFNGFFKKGYRSILTGVSYMLPFVVFGGIMIALAFLIDILSHYTGVINLNTIGFNQLGGATATAKWFGTIGHLGFDLIVPILAAYICFAMVGKMGLLVGFVVGFMATGKSNSLLNLINLNRVVVNIGNQPINIIDVNSGFFGAIIGAFIAAAILIALNKYLFKYIPQSLSGIKTILIIPLIGTILVATVFWFINIPLQFLNLGFTHVLNFLESRPYIAWLLGLTLGAMMAFDLGGPVNKAAYVFGTTTLSTALASQLNSDGPSGSVAMAAVMISGMIPPLGIALSTLVGKKYWTVEDRSSAISNWIFGLSFISEGAIPFTAKYPKILVPANVIAGALTGLISVLFGLSVQAPHGGIFVFLLFNSNLVVSKGASLGLGIALFILTLIIGTIIHAGFLQLFFILNDQKDKNRALIKLNQMTKLLITKTNNLKKIKDRFKK
ncbi:PTS system, fructose-specific IIABC component [[Mycoplasma] cavipharyngis]|uniref:PTS fructose transporter subunit IIABC n=1 Tax=[Mycoplasma] cavipharyngis TaxID=92757 RepID=UPI0037045A75